VTLHQFGLFVSIAKRLNITQISRDLHISQSPKIVVFFHALLGGWLLLGNPFIGNGSFRSPMGLLTRRPVLLARGNSTMEQDRRRLLILRAMGIRARSKARPGRAGKSARR
jgi:hypothetical protein